VSDAGRIEAQRDLVAGLFPELSLEGFQPIEGGWTCDTYRAGDSWIVQLPRTRYAEERLRRQIEVLPELAGEVSSAVPMPELASLDPVCMAYRAIEGVPCVELGAAGIWPERLGRFLYDLHMAPPEFLGMRVTTARAVRDDLRERWMRLRELASPYLTGEGARAVHASIEGIFDDDAAWAFAPCVTHGDLVPEHVLVTPSGDLSGVIDWEEIGVGDPAWDFAWFVHAMPSEGERALAAYGGQPDAGFAIRAALSFALMPLHELEHGVETDRPDLVTTRARDFLERSQMLGPQAESSL
jgi:aminoglycoside 2''-phosphotransferase